MAQLLGRREVEQRYNFTTSVLYGEIRNGRFPKPLRISPGRVAWDEDECEAWRAERKAERDSPHEQRTNVRRSLEVRAARKAAHHGGAS